MTASGKGAIRIGIGGWVFEPWRGGMFYPDDLPQKRELEYASRKLTAIEINSTFYGSQKPETFAKWREETPDGFIFTVKGPRFATNRRVLAEAGESIDRFFASGVLELGDKLGPINWQFAITKKFDPDDFAAFLKLLPKKVKSRAVRHAVEVSHETFKDKAFVDLARAHEVAVIVDGQSHRPMIADITGPFVYARITGAEAKHKAGYPKKTLDEWAERASAWASGDCPKDLPLLTPAPSLTPRDVFLFAISGDKERNPAAAMALIKRLE